MFKRIPQEIWQQVFERLQNSLKYRLISRTFTDIDVSDALPPVAGTALADMALVPAANRRGDAVGFADVALDLTFGGLCGGGFGTASGLLHNRRVAGLAGEQSRLAELLGEAGYESADAGRLAASAIAHIADMPRRKDLSDAVRRNLAGMDRLGAGKLLDRMMIAIRDGENPDVGKWAAELRLLPTISRIERDRLIQVLESGEFETVTFGRLSPDKMEALNAVRAEEGVSLLKGDQLVIPANVAKKFYEKRILQDGHTPDDVAQMLLDVFHLDADAVSSTRYPHIQALVKLRDELSTLGFIARNPKNGETVIKSVYQEKTGGIGKRLDRKKEPVREGGHSSISVGDESPLAAGRLSDLQTDSVALNISTSRSIVNVAEFHSDFTAPAPKTVIKSVNLVIVSRKGIDDPDSRLVSMYIGEPDQESSKRKVSSIPSSRWLAVDKDTSQGSTISTPDGRGDKIEEIFSDFGIDTKGSSVKTSPPLNVTVPLSETKLRQDAMPQARDKDPASAANGESAAVKSGRQRFWRRLWGKLFGAE